MNTQGQRMDTSPDSAEIPGAACLMAIRHAIVRFEDRLRGVLDYNSFSYENSEAAQFFSTGKQQPHYCSYHVIVDELCLGTISMSRMTPFRESELQLFEAYLSDLCLHLHSLTR